ncbi:hypothetical protein DIPPA_17068 [Diplonema papillatum]|nr:hypothetical protein DIPPA_17068 [Diplonema papillatum]|eukprot:gene20286-31218_t
MKRTMGAIARRAALPRHAQLVQARGMKTVGRTVAAREAAGSPAGRVGAPLLVSKRWCTVVKCPVIAESISEGTVGGWEVKAGDSVLEDALLGSIESEKVNIDIRAPHNGIVTEILVEEGTNVNVGADLLKLKEADVPPEGEPAKAAKTADAPEKKPDATPKPAAAAKPAPAAAAAAPAQAEPAQQYAASTDREKRVRITPMRRRIADRLKASQNTAAMLTTFQEVDMSNLIALRTQHKEEFAEKHGVKLGFMSAFVKASACALQAVPVVNAYLDTETDAIIFHDYCDISVAVATPKGLVVPVLRDCQEMNFADIEKQIGVFADKAKNGSLSIREMSGGTFTISNGGTYGSWMGTPIINPPQSAVLGMHATKQKAWVDKDGKISARPIMALALTYDHRLIDGRDAVTFLVKIRNLIESPERMLLDLA